MSVSLACGKSWLSCHHDPITPEDLITGTPKVPAAVPPMSDSVSSDPASPSRPSRPSMPGVAAVGAKQVVRGRRLFHEFQTAVTATSERVG
eukprot:s2024_g1.t1